MERVLAHRDYNLSLQPLPGGSKRDFDRAAGSQQQDEQGPTTKRERKLMQQLAAAQAQNNQSTAPAKGNGKGKGQKKGKAKIGNMPTELRFPGATSTDDKGDAICFAFNTAGGCDAAPAGGKCAKGRHICMVYGCRQKHAMAVHHKR